MTTTQELKALHEASIEHLRNIEHSKKGYSPVAVQTHAENYAMVQAQILAIHLKNNPELNKLS